MYLCSGTRKSNHRQQQTHWFHKKIVLKNIYKGKRNEPYSLMMLLHIRVCFIIRIKEKINKKVDFRKIESSKTTSEQKQWFYKNML